ncbi:hypothetical protein TL16_g13372, partial [Triparma laevis f. inornata]
IVSAGEDGNVIIWEVESGEKINTLVGHAEPVQDVGVTPNDDKVVSASTDNPPYGAAQRSQALEQFK